MSSNYPAARKALIQGLRAKGISDQRVLDAISSVPRENFVNPQYKDVAYSDRALPLAEGQTISQPYVVAAMTEALLTAVPETQISESSKPLYRVLEIGTGSGYQAAVLSALADKVYSIERIENLYLRAKSKLSAKRYQNIQLKYADGYLGWHEYAPFDAVIVTAAAGFIPQALKDQLADDGRLIIPVGDQLQQQLQLLVRRGDDFEQRLLDYVIFVPMLPGKE